MKENYINVTFIIDSSGSMIPSTNDVINGFLSTIEEQKKVDNGKCTVSLYTFNKNVKEVYIGKDVNEIDSIDYVANGCTAMLDGIGTAIDNVGKWLADMQEDERPSKNLVVIMTDGRENSSVKYSYDKIKEMIKHQEDKYSWSFIYMGTDVTSLNDVEKMGIRTRAFSSRNDYATNYSVINNAASIYRTTDVRCASATMDAFLCAESDMMTAKYEKENNIKIK